MAGDQDQDSPQGPVDPSGPGGIDAPAPPGGPQRTDAPSGPATPGTPAQDPGPGTQRVTRPETGGAPEPTEPDTGQDIGERGQQEENAETSLDQPSQ